MQPRWLIYFFVLLLNMNKRIQQPATNTLKKIKNE